MRTMLACILFLSLSVAAVQAAPPHHALVRVDVSSAADEAWLLEHLTEFDLLMAKPGSWAEIAAAPADLQRLRAAGLPVTVLQADMEAAVSYADKGPGFGAFHTRSESIAFVDSLRLLYPEVVSEKWSIGTTGEGRDIWAFRVSANPDLDEDEPEILIDAMHHAREIMASEFPLMFAEYLALNYGVDPEITWLLDNRELYLVPIVNPDGFVYNEQTNPDGGGLWRKNRRDNGDGSFGVDPNRNYPFQWGYDDSGSSPSPSSEVYRGPSPGSEPEVQAMMAFVNSREFRTHDTVHTYGNLTLLPWGYTADPPPDADIFATMGAAMTQFNGYTAGGTGSVLYPVNGGTFDWTYGATGEHGRIFSVSNEIGSSAWGFWPPESLRGQLFRENIWPHIYLMRVAGSFLAVHTPVTAPVAAKDIGPGEAGLLTFTVENQSVMDDSDPVSITLKSDDAWLQLDEAVRTIGALGPMGTDDLGGAPVPFSVDAGCPDGHVATVTARVDMAEGSLEYEMRFRIGTPMALVSEDFETGTGNWTLSGGWAATTEASNSPSTSLSDSPGTDYDDSSATSATLNGEYDATSFSFWHRFDIEEGWDYGRVQVSADGGAWTTLESFTGLQTGWNYHVYDLGDYAGSLLRFRFLLETDVSVVEDGWWIDDVTVDGVDNSNTPPTAPVPDMATGIPDKADFAHLLRVQNSTDADADPLTYGFRVYADSLGTDLVASVDGVAEDPGGYTEWVTPLLPDAAYWFRSFAFDGTDRSPLSPLYLFATRVSSVALPGLDGARLDVLGSVSGRGAELRISLPTAREATVDIYDLRGARVRRLHTGRLEGGERILSWDGRDSGGRAAASGVYFVRVALDAGALSGRVVLVR